MAKAIEKTEVQKFIDILRGYYKAAGELNEVANKYGDDFQRTAQRHLDMLDKEIKERLASWNEEEIRIVECIRALDCWDKTCRIFYTEAADEDGRCDKCAEQHKIQTSWEHAR